MSPTLTKKQTEVLEYICSHIQDYGYAPSYREIADNFGLSSPATVHGHVQSLVDKNVIKIGGDGEARSIELVEEIQGSPSISLPLLGLIAAGEPIEALEDNETMAVPADFVLDGSNSYVLKIKGQSMIEDGIFDGDFVVIERNPSPQNGEVVVALLDNANSTMDPIFVKDCIIQGVVRAVIRKFQPV